MLTEHETKVFYPTINRSSILFTEHINLFQTQLNKHFITDEKGNVYRIAITTKCGFEGYTPCDIQEVIIYPPPKNGRGNTGGGVIGGGDHPPGGGCPAHQMCLDDGSGGGGGSSTPSPTTNPCDKAKISVNKANVSLNDSRLKNAFTDRMRTITNTTTGSETSITIGKNEYDQLHIGLEITKTGNQGSVQDPPSGYGSYIDGHNHEYGHPPSPGDLWTMLERIASSQYFESRYIFSKDSNETLYALTVNNRQNAMSFLQNYPKDQYLEKNAEGKFTGRFKEGTNIQLEYKTTFDSFFDNGSGEFNAIAAVQAFILDYFNTGISISKKTNLDSSLKAISTTLINNANYSTTECY